MRTIALIVTALLLSAVSFSQEPQVQEAKEESPRFETSDVESPPEIYSIVGQSAEFPGGKEAMNKFLSTNLHYPQSAVDAGKQGKCYIKFVVTKRGKIQNVTVQKSVPDCPECDAEAVRVINKMPK